MTRWVLVLALAGCRDKAAPPAPVEKPVGTPLVGIAMTPGECRGTAMLNAPPPFTSVVVCEGRISVARADGAWVTPVLFEPAAKIDWVERDLTSSKAELTLVATTSTHAPACDGHGTSQTILEEVAAIADAPTPVYWKPIVTHRHESQIPNSEEEPGCPTREIDSQLGVEWRGKLLVLTGTAPGAGTYRFELP